MMMGFGGRVGWAETQISVSFIIFRVKDDDIISIERFLSSVT